MKFIWLHRQAKRNNLTIKTNIAEMYLKILKKRKEEEKEYCSNSNYKDHKCR